MPDALTTISKLINSPPGQLAAGGVLAGIVWKFFERVESVLKDDTKREIAVGLLDKKIASTVNKWTTVMFHVYDIFVPSHVYGWPLIKWFTINT